jgi:hypothetical protein
LKQKKYKLIGNMVKKTSFYKRYSLGRHMHRSSKSHKISRKSKMKVGTVTMKAGTLLFHGHADAREWAIPHNRPAFFGGTLVAMYYADSRPDFVSTYVLLKDAVLLDLGNKSNIKKYYDSLNTEDARVFSRVTGYNLTELKGDVCRYKGKKRTDVRFCTEDFIDPDDEKTDNYGMLRFAKMICSHGYDGYYIPPIHEQHGKSKSLNEQIILCKPKDAVLKVNQLSLKSVVSNMRHMQRRSKSKRRR